jgi:hypothetical protein
MFCIISLTKDGRQWISSLAALLGHICCVIVVCKSFFQRCKNGTAWQMFDLRHILINFFLFLASKVSLSEICSILIDKEARSGKYLFGSAKFGKCLARTYLLRHCRLQVILSTLQEWHSLALMGIHRE